MVGMLCALCAGCGSPPAQTGVRIGDETLEQFKAGTTTEAWLVAVLGPPTETAFVADLQNTKVMRYSLVEAANGLGSLFGGTSTRNAAVVYFVVTDGIVTRFWADRDVKHTLTGKPIEQSGEKKGG
jgi:hypothetical protein